MSERQEIEIHVKTPLPDDTFRLRRLRGTERVSTPFELRVELFSGELGIDLEEIVGQPISIEVAPGGETLRTWTGIVARFGQAGIQERYAVYEAVVVPWIWLLSRSAGCDIFNETTTLEILKTVLRRAPRADFDLPSSGWAERDYCVQYRETDLAFASRLLEEDGFYWYIEPDGESHKLVAVDGAQACATLLDVKYSLDESHLDETNLVSEFAKTQEVTPGSYEMVDFEYGDPRIGEPLESVGSEVGLSVASDLKWYDFPGEFGKLSRGDTSKLRDWVKLRMAEQDSRAVVYRGKSKVWGLLAGHGIRLDDHFRGDFAGEYLLTEVHHDLTASGDLEAGTYDDFSYSNSFTCVPDAIRYVPPRLVSRPRIRGVHTAVVKEAIDGQGRVRLEFPWCKGKTSCWTRVAQTLAGGGWGAQFHPRVGHEVVVDFYEGDPDLPLVVGRVYNGENEGPYSAKHSQGGVKSRSMEGNPDNHNEIRIEDEKGAEQLFFHAERDHVIEVENDEQKEIGANRSEKVEKNVTIKIGGDRSETVDGARKLSVGGAKTEAVSGAKSISVSKDHTETIEGEQKVDVGKDRSVNVGKSLTESAGNDVSVSSGKAMSHSAGKDATVSVGENWKVDVGKEGKITISKGLGIEAKEISIEAADKLTIKVGSASLSMKKNGDVVIEGKKIDVKGSSDVKIKGSKSAVN